MAVDATGKIGSRVGIGDDAVRVTTAGARSQGGNAAARSAENAQDGSTVLDQVDLRLSRTIQENLDPAQLSAERSAKVAKLKEMIAAGNYKPSAEEIAQSVARELAEEIYFSSDTTSRSPASLMDVLAGSKE